MSDFELSERTKQEIERLVLRAVENAVTGVVRTTDLVAAKIGREITDLKVLRAAAAKLIETVAEENKSE